MNGEMLETIACPLCESTRRRELKFESQLIILAPGERIVRCRRCGFVYLNPRRSAGAVRSDWYDKEDYYTYYEQGIGAVGYQEGDAADHLKRRLREVESDFGRKGSLLDVGCGKGYFLAHAKKLGWSVQGVEVSAFAAQFAARTHAVPVINATLEDAHLPPSAFDVIHMNHVLEHIYNLAPVLAEVRRVLSPGGVFVVEVPNQFAFLGYRLRKILLPSLLRRSKQGELNFHVSFFTKRTLVRLLRKHGFHPYRVQAKTWFPIASARGFLSRQIKHIIWKAENRFEAGENLIVYARSEHHSLHR